MTMVKFVIKKEVFVSSRVYFKDLSYRVLIRTYRIAY